MQRKIKRNKEAGHIKIKKTIGMLVGAMALSIILSSCASLEDSVKQSVVKVELEEETIDATPMEITADSKIEIYKDDIFNPDDYIKISGSSDNVKINYDKKMDTSKIGSSILRVEATDDNGNIASKEIEVVILENKKSFTGSQIAVAVKAFASQLIDDGAKIECSDANRVTDCYRTIKSTWKISGSDGEEYTLSCFANVHRNKRSLNLGMEFSHNSKYFSPEKIILQSKNNSVIINSTNIYDIYTAFLCMDGFIVRIDEEDGTNVKDNFDDFKKVINDTGDVAISFEGVEEDITFCLSEEFRESWKSVLKVIDEALTYYK